MHIGYALSIFCVIGGAAGEVNLTMLLAAPMDLIRVLRREPTEIEAKDLFEMVLFLLAVVFAPLTLLAVACAGAHTKFERAWEAKVNRVRHDWEELASKRGNLHLHQLCDDNEQERYALLVREVARSMPTESMKFMSQFNVDEHRHMRYKILVHAAIDELLERAIMKERK
jgi:hypothetical protein